MRACRVCRGGTLRKKSRRKLKKKKKEEVDE